MTRLAAILALALSLRPAAGTAEAAFRVCADPNNMPFSNAAGEGFENKLAELIADDLGEEVQYTWHAQRRGFVRETLKAGKCDVIMGVPEMDMVLRTRPYYRSGYVFVSRADRGYAFDSILAPELRNLTIGAHLIGDDGANTPPIHALAERGIVDNVRGYMIYGDYRQDSPPMRLLDDVVAGKVDVAAVWGPLGGYYASRSEVPLRVVAIADSYQFLPLMFEYSISIGLRKDEQALKYRLNAILENERDAIRQILESYRVPML